VNPELDEPVFRAPWEAHAFAIVLSLHRAGLFTWGEWAATLAACIAEAQAGGGPDEGDTYYRHWLAALERLVAAKGGGSAAELERTRLAWARAAERTPHGRPIELRSSDFDGDRLQGGPPEGPPK
jgi:nitrile hydratase accessory protein